MLRPITKDKRKLIIRIGKWVRMQWCRGTRKESIKRIRWDIYKAPWRLEVRFRRKVARCQSENKFNRKPHTCPTPRIMKNSCLKPLPHSEQDLLKRQRKKTLALSSAPLSTRMLKIWSNSSSRRRSRRRPSSSKAPVEAFSTNYSAHSPTKSQSKMLLSSTPTMKGKIRMRPKSRTMPSWTTIRRIGSNRMTSSRINYSTTRETTSFDIFKKFWWMIKTE